MRRDLIAAAVSVVLMTLLLGVAYPLVMTGASQVLFPHRADGSPLTRDGKPIGSRLIGQDFRRPVLGTDGKPRLDSDGEPVLEADPRYFQSRPSASGYNPAGTTFSNLGPNSVALRDAIEANTVAYLDLERRYAHGLERRDVPGDAVMSSASGVDPHISLANARIQSHRVAAARSLSRARVLELIDDSTDGRDLGVMGDPGVNVLELNLALDREAA